MRKQKWAAAVLTTAMSVSVLAGCGGGADQPGGESPEASENFNESGFPIVNEPINLTFFTGKASTSANNWNETKLWQEYAKMTNMNIEFQLIPFENLEERRNLALAGGDYPHAFHTSRLTTQDLAKYGAQGVFIPLNDLIDQYAPNLKKLMDENPDLRKGMTMPDGNIYGMPTIYDPEFTSVLMGNRFWYNKEWLDALGMEEPQTIDEFYDYLVAVKNTDLNGNGQQDEIAMGTHNYKDMIHTLKGFWGLMNRGFSSANVDMDPETNELRYIPADDRFKSLLEFLNKLYSEGLLDPELFTIKSNEFYAKGANNVYGVVHMTSPETLLNLETFAGLPVLEGPYGDKMFSRTRSTLVGAAPFVITDKNPDPAATVRWMDYFYSDEGSKLFFMGFEGESYTESADGELEYTEEIVNNPDGLTFEQALVKYVTWPGGSYPGIVRQQFFKGAESLPASIESAEKVEPYLIDEIWPVFTYTVEEAERYQALHSDLNTYMEEMQAKFISGNTPFSEWDSYINTLNRMGLQDYMDLHKAAYERYISN